MPDLSLETSHFQWLASQDREAYNIVCMMEAIEEWTLDGDQDVEDALTNLGFALENIENINLKHKDELITICAYLKTARFLSLMLYLDSAYPGAAPKLISYAESKAHINDDAALFLKRNLIFERMRLILRVFSPKRLALLKAALENESET
jgi:intracellular multiplication protein IcmW